MKKLLIYSFILFSMRSEYALYAQSQNLNNSNLENVNSLWINDPGPEEGIKWLGTAANWNIDITPENRSNADGNLNIYGISNNIVLWRPAIIKGSDAYLYLSSSSAPSNDKNWYFSLGSDGKFRLSTADDNYSWINSVLTAKRNGNIGIGETEPLSKLTVYGKISDGWNSGIELNREGGGKGWIVVDGDGMKFRTPNDGDGFWFRDNDNNTSLVIRDGGNIGIGTMSPSAKLTISGSHVSGKGLLNLNSTEGSISAMTFYQGGSYSGAIFAGTDNDMYFGTEGSDNLKFYTNNVNHVKMIIDQGGNVGIGTPTPQNKLEVNGTIRATEIKVATGWADYVFHQNYPLKPLSEVDQFIKENKHLPNVPTEKEVKENGVNLGEMNKILLEKVEELTLYMIEQNKEMQQLKQENKEIKEQLEVIKSSH